MNPEQCIGVMTKDGFYRVKGTVKGVIVSDPFQVDGGVMTFLAADKSTRRCNLPNLVQMASHPDLVRTTLMEHGFRIAAGEAAMEILVTALIFPEAVFVVV